MKEFLRGFVHFVACVMLLILATLGLIGKKIYEFGSIKDGNVAIGVTIVSCILSILTSGSFETTFAIIAVVSTCGYIAHYIDVALS